VLRGGAGWDLEAVAARRRVIVGMAVTRLAYDDDDGGVCGSALDEESRGGGGESNSTPSCHCGACSGISLHVCGSLTHAQVSCLRRRPPPAALRALPRLSPVVSNLFLLSPAHRLRQVHHRLGQRLHPANWMLLYVHTLRRALTWRARAHDRARLDRLRGRGCAGDYAYMPAHRRPARSAHGLFGYGSERGCEHQ
jgi:hypothetical protein